MISVSFAPSHLASPRLWSTRLGRNSESLLREKAGADQTKHQGMWANLHDSQARAAQRNFLLGDIQVYVREALPRETYFDHHAVAVKR